MKQTIALLTAWIAVSVPAAAQCVASQQYGVNSSTSISLYVGSGWNPSDPPPISAAVSMWKNSCFGMQGRDFPSLSTGTSGSLSIPVALIDANNPVPGGGCGFFDAVVNSQDVVIGGQINVYKRTNAGGDCLYVMPHVTLDNLIAHELGHVLGLANVHGTECNSYIMSDRWSTASIQTDECDFVDETWDMPNEPPDTPPDGTTCPQQQTSCNPSPIILSFDGAYRMTSPEGGVSFDIDADGVVDRVAWTARDSGLAFLTLDRNANGRIDDGSELFGDNASLVNGAKAANGFEALRELDANGDGVIDTDDVAWSSLQLWFDLDHDGQSSAGELIPIASTEIVSVHTAYKSSGRKDQFGNTFRYRGEFTLTQGVRKCYDIYLKTVD
jgi:hypothetical protein